MTKAKIKNGMQLYTKLNLLVKSAENDLQNGAFHIAIAQFLEAYHLIPTPKEEWEATTWVLTRLGNAYFQNSEYQLALTNFENVMEYSIMKDNAAIHLRLGQCYFELGNHKQAKQALNFAYKLDPVVFNNENKKYLLDNKIAEI